MWVGARQDSSVGDKWHGTMDELRWSDQTEVFTDAWRKTENNNHLSASSFYEVSDVLEFDGANIYFDEGT